MHNIHFTIDSWLSLFFIDDLHNDPPSSHVSLLISFDIKYKCKLVGTLRLPSCFFFCKYYPVVSCPSCTFCCNFSCILLANASHEATFILYIYNLERNTPYGTHAGRRRENVRISRKNFWRKNIVN